MEAFWEAAFARVTLCTGIQSTPKSFLNAVYPKTIFGIHPTLKSFSESSPTPKPFSESTLSQKHFRNPVCPEGEGGRDQMSTLILSFVPTALVAD